jgi:ATP adenylyltransferase/5',5'''-P-1,P-4-tetraphosphate phosphorylase II
MKAIDGFIYFNSGVNSGASVPHKHMQVIPYKSIKENCLPVEEEAILYCRNNQI